MASLNPEAPEFIFPYNYTPLPIFSYHLTYFYSSYPPSLFSTFPSLETQSSLTTYNNSDICYLVPQWHHLQSSSASSMAVERGVTSEDVVPRIGTTMGGKPSRRESRKEWLGANSNQERMIWKQKAVGVCEERSSRRKSSEPKLIEMEPIQRGGTKTTIMIRNIPNKYNKEMLLDLLDKHCMKENQKQKLEKPTEVDENSSSAFDFVYLPIDFGSKCNKGYAFVNFTNPNAVWKFHLSMHNYKWGILNSKKICEITYAKIQGKEALIKHFQKSSFTCEKDDYLPTYFNPRRDGTDESVVQLTVGRRLTDTVSS